VAVPPFRQGFVSAPLIQGSAVSQLAPEYPVIHEHPQLPAAKVPVAEPPF